MLNGLQCGWQEVFKSVRGKVIKFLKVSCILCWWAFKTDGQTRSLCCEAAPPHSDEAILAAALLKRLADVLFTVKKDATWLRTCCKESPHLFWGVLSSSGVFGLMEHVCSNMQGKTSF